MKPKIWSALGLNEQTSKKNIILVITFVTAMGPLGDTLVNGFKQLFPNDLQATFFATVILFGVTGVLWFIAKEQHKRQIRFNEETPDSRKMIICSVPSNVELLNKVTRLHNCQKLYFFYDKTSKYPKEIENDPRWTFQGNTKVDSLNNFNAVIDKFKDCLDHIEAQGYTKSDIIVDITPGKSSFSAALTLIAQHYGIDIQYIDGEKTLLLDFTTKENYEKK